MIPGNMHDPDTSVLCHVNGHFRHSGKAHDCHGAIGCNECHDTVDGRTGRNEDDYIAHLEAVIRTQQHWIKSGYMAWHGMDLSVVDFTGFDRLKRWTGNINKQLRD